MAHELPSTRRHAMIRAAARNRAKGVTSGRQRRGIEQDVAQQIDNAWNLASSMRQITKPPPAPPPRGSQSSDAYVQSHMRRHYNNSLVVPQHAPYAAYRQGLVELFTTLDVPIEMAQDVVDEFLLDGDGMNPNKN